MYKNKKISIFLAFSLFNSTTNNSNENSSNLNLPAKSFTNKIKAVNNPVLEELRLKYNTAQIKYYTMIPYEEGRELIKIHKIAKDKYDLIIMNIKEVHNQHLSGIREQDKILRRILSISRKTSFKSANSKIIAQIIQIISKSKYFDDEDFDLREKIRRHIIFSPKFIIDNTKFSVLIHFIERYRDIEIEINNCQKALSQGYEVLKDANYDLIITENNLKTFLFGEYLPHCLTMDYIFQVSNAFFEAEKALKDYRHSSPNVFLLADHFI